MQNYRANAVVAGLLFFAATATGTVSLPVAQAVIAAPDHMTAISANTTQVTFGALLVFLMGIASAGIALALYPVLRKGGEGKALAAVVFRAMEGLLDMIGALLILTLIPLSATFVMGGESAAVAGFGDGLIELRGWISHVGVLTCWSIGALFYYAIFFRTRLVPRWLSLWGIVGIVLTLCSILLYLFGLIAPMSTLHVGLNLPIALQEMVLAAWLVFKGFDRSALKRLEPAAR